MAGYRWRVIGVNDYPWPSAPCGANNPNDCSYSYRNCTDFCQWRIRHDLGAGCLYLGNADMWASKAAALGYRVDGSPAPGSILMDPSHVNGAGSVGHVAFVLGVGPGTFFGVTAGTAQVAVEDYDWLRCGYLKHALPISGSRFIHVRDLSGPPPSPAPTPVPVPVPTPPPTTPGSLLVPALVTLAGITGVWYALHRDPTLGERIRRDAGALEQRIARLDTGLGFRR